MTERPLIRLTWYDPKTGAAGELLSRSPGEIAGRKRERLALGCLVDVCYALSGAPYP